MSGERQLRSSIESGGIDDLPELIPLLPERLLPLALAAAR